jgi:hypothetical protein
MLAGGLPRRSSGFCSKSSLEALRVGRSAVGCEEEEADRPLFFGALLSDELGAIEPRKSQVTRLHSAVHWLREFRDSGTHS